MKTLEEITLWSDEAHHSRVSLKPDEAGRQVRVGMICQGSGLLKVCGRWTQEFFTSEICRMRAKVER